MLKEQQPSVQRPAPLRETSTPDFSRTNKGFITPVKRGDPLEHRAIADYSNVFVGYDTGEKAGKGGAKKGGTHTSKVKIPKVKIRPNERKEFQDYGGIRYDKNGKRI
jgi:hypothetical protein